ncbi:uncharacterized protein LOC116767490 [Danaus plexippus]|nr:uncharacterized protein LOC116767490 [Danaus plexippus]
MFIIICLLSPLFSVYVNSAHIDQSQTGDYNFQVDVKDVQIFALMNGESEEDYMEYDYAYDYSQLTIKPQNRTTPRPLNITVISTELNNLKDNLTTVTPVQGQTIGLFTSETTSSDFISTTTNYFVDDNTTEKTAEIASTKKVVTTTPRTTIKCKKGFFLNKKGECQLQLNNTGNALLKLVKLSQRMKLRRENKSNENS